MSSIAYSSPSSNPGAAGPVTMPYLLPIFKNSKHNAAVTLNTNIFGTGITPTNTPSTLRIYCAFVGSGTLNVQRTNSAVTVVENLNQGTALTANAAYIFDVLTESGDSINLQYSISTTASKIIVVQLVGV